MNIEEKKARIAALKAEVRADEKAKKKAQLFALGEEVQRAIKAKKLSWSDIKVVLEQTVKKKKNRELLGLGESANLDNEKKPDSSTSEIPAFFSNKTSKE